MTTHQELSPAPVPVALVVVSKIKQYINIRSVALKESGFNTSDACMEKLSSHIREVLDRAIIRAASEGRKTVLDRDIEYATDTFQDPVG